MCNPTFDIAEKFIDTLIKAYELDDNTRAVLIVPVRRNAPWFEELVADTRFKLVCYWTKSVGTFSGANKVDSLAIEGRVNYGKNYDDILAFELSKAAPTYPTLKFADIPDMRKDLVEQVCVLRAADANVNEAEEEK